MPLAVAGPLVAVSAFIWYLMLNVDLDGSVAPRGLLAATAIFAVAVMVTAGALAYARRSR